MKAVLISIQPKWCELIASGKKTVEVRKTRPKMETPFKCYIYKTKKRILRDVTRKGQEDWFGIADRTIIISCPDLDGGKVIGEFVCDRVDKYTFSNLEAEYRINDIDIAKTCLNHPELIEYGKGKPLYGWHISELKIYDKPKELGEFRKAGFMTEEEWLYALYPNTHCHYQAWAKRFELTRPPQSWCFVEEEK